MELSQAYVYKACIETAVFFSTILFILIIRRTRLDQKPSVSNPTQLLYSRFIILFYITFVAQSLQFILNAYIVFFIVTGSDIDRSEATINNWILELQKSNGDSIDLFVPYYVITFVFGVAVSYLYFYYDKFICNFRMKGIPALIILGTRSLFINSQIINFYWGGGVLSIVVFITSILNIIAIGLMCINLNIARKSILRVKILLVSFIIASVFQFFLSLFFISFAHLKDIEDALVSGTLFNGVNYLGYFSIILVGMLMFAPPPSK